MVKKCQDEIAILCIFYKQGSVEIFGKDSKKRTALKNTASTVKLSRFNSTVNI
jgi:hypothetical protein